MSVNWADRKYMRSDLRAFTALAVILVAGSCFSVDSALANPSGAVVVGGGATVAGQGTDRVTIKQNTDRAAINWDTFSVGLGERTDFVQPSKSSVVLNRVTGSDASQIFGSINANGIIILSNRNGILIGKEGSVNAGGFIATTHDVDTEDFVSGAGHLRFSGQGGTTDARVENNGTITISDVGLAAFVAPIVRNRGTIIANLGRVSLVGANGFTIDLYGDDLISFTLGDRILETLRLEDGSSLKSLVENSGEIRANGGRIELTALQAREVVNQSVNISGTLAADTAEEREGEIILSAHDAYGQASGQIFLSAESQVLAQGNSIGENGGTITISGKEIVMDRGSSVSADGKSVGGSVLVGGGYQGQGDMLHADAVELRTGAKISADGDSGAGGKVVLWSDVYTQMDGTIEATGGLLGGIVETSSKGWLGLTGNVDASSDAGVNGEWLLDPSNVTIGASGNSVPIGGGITNPSADSYTVLASSISAALNAGNNVAITTTNAAGAQEGNISISSEINKTSGGDATLTLKAENNILMSANITSSSNKLNTIFWADSDASEAGAIALIGRKITSNGGNVTLAGGLDDGANGGVAGDGIPDGYAWGTSSYTAGISISGSGGGINSGAGDILLRGHGQNNASLAAQHGVFQSGGIVQSSSGTISAYGIGGNGTDHNMGVYVTSNSTKMTVDTGTINITGYGNGSTNLNFGVFIGSYGSVSSTGTGAGVGSINIVGYGGNGAGTSNQGIDFESNGSISSVDADVFLAGTGGLNSGYGVVLGYNGGSVLSSGAANISITGTALKAGYNDFFIGGSDGFNYTVGGSSATGSITIIGDKVVAHATGTKNIQTAGDIIIRSRTASTNIGMNGGLGTLALSSTFLNMLHPGNRLVIGDSAGTNTGAVAINGWDLTGQTYDVEVYGGSISFSGNPVLWNNSQSLLFAANGSSSNISISKPFTYSGSGDSNLTLKSKNNIITSLGAGVTASNGKLNTVLWSDSDASGNGAVYLIDAKITSNGGDVTLAGGLDDGANGGASGDGIPDNYAWGASSYNKGVYIYGASAGIVSSEGDILLRGHGINDASLSQQYGVWLAAGMVLQTSTGNIYVDGIGGTGIEWTEGIQITNNTTQVLTERGAITLIGVAGDASVNNHNIGIEIDYAQIISTGVGDGLGAITINGTGKTGSHGVRFAYGSVQQVSSVDADISITGVAAGTSGAGIDSYEGSNIFSTGRGNITLTATGAGSSKDLDFANQIGYTDYIGSLSGNGNITIISNSIDAYSGSAVFRTSGNITIKPRTASTTIGLNGGAGTLALTSTILNSLNPGTSLIIGDSTGANTGAVSINGWDLTGKTYNVEVYGGPITFSGNPVLWNNAQSLLFAASGGSSDINISKPFTYSGSGISNLTLKANNSIKTSSGAGITASNGKLNTVLWSDSDASGAGAISLSNTQITSNGGNVTLAGGLDDGANGGTAGDDIPDNYAWGTADNRVGIDIYRGGINTADGSILIRAKAKENETDSYIYGIRVYGTAVLQSISGNISLYGTGGSHLSGNMGIYVAEAGTKITTEKGLISLTGVGGSGTGSANFGIWVQNYAQISAAGDGSIALYGVGGSGASSTGSNGIGISNNASITTVDGDVNITGTAGSSSANGMGIYFYNTSSNISSTGLGSISLTATSNGDANDIVFGVGVGYEVALGGINDHGSIKINADTLSIANGALNIQTLDNITIQPRTAGRTIGLAGGSGALSLTPALFDSLHAGGRVIIGDSASGLITANAYTWGNNVSLYSGSGITINGAQNMGGYNFFAQTYGASNITFGSSGTITSSAADDAVDLIAGQYLVNNRGSDAISTSNGRWLVYLANPAGNTFGGLNSGNTAVWDAVYGDTITQSGNRYVFAYQPTVTFTSTNDSKTYGADATSAVASDYTVSGLQAGVTNAYLADSNSSVFFGAPSVTSTGSAAVAQVSGSPYAITVSAGTLSALSGYAFSYESIGALTINKAPLIITADDKTKVYGEANPSYTVSYSGFVNGEGAGVLSTLPLAQSLAAGDFPHVGIYDITASGASADNYQMSYVVGHMSVVPATLVVSAENKSRIYGEANPSLSLSYSGFVNGDTLANISTPPSAATAAGITSSVGGYAISPFGAVDADYNFSYVNGTLTVSPVVLGVVGDFEVADRIFNGTTSAEIINNGLSLSGVKSWDTGGVLLNPTASFESLLIGSGKNVHLSSLTYLSGGAAGNYMLDLTGSPTATASITSIPHEYTASVMNSIAGGDQTDSTKTDYAETQAVFGEILSVANTSLEEPHQVVGVGQMLLICAPNRRNSRCEIQE